MENFKAGIDTISCPTRWTAPPKCEDAIKAEAFLSEHKGGNFPFSSSGLSGGASSKVAMWAHVPCLLAVCLLFICDDDGDGPGTCLFLIQSGLA